MLHINIFQDVPSCPPQIVVMKVLVLMIAFVASCRDVVMSYSYSFEHQIVLMRAFVSFVFRSCMLMLLLLLLQGVDH